MSTDLGETEEGIILASAVAGDKSPVPDKNTSIDCKSCGAVIEEIYCGNCGQKNDDLRRSLWRLVGESLGGLFSFEGRMWRTWGALLYKPGKVAYEYANGARSRYSPPIRVYLVVSFMFFSFLAATQTNLFAISVQPKINEEIAPSSETEPTAIPKIGLKENQSTIMNDFSFEFLFFQSQKEFDRLENKAVSDNFLNTLKADTEIKNNIEDGALDADPLKAFQTFLKKPKQFNAAFNTWLPRVMFFMVPFAMFMGIIFIRGPTALLYDHLVHAMYVHAVFFLTLLFAVILAKIMPGAIVARILIIAFIIYLPLSLKRMFNRGWFKTILTTAVVTSVYSLFLLSAILLISIFSIVNLAT